MARFPIAQRRRVMKRQRHPMEFSESRDGGRFSWSSDDIGLRWRDELFPHLGHGLVPQVGVGEDHRQDVTDESGSDQDASCRGDGPNLRPQSLNRSRHVTAKYRLTSRRCHVYKPNGHGLDVHDLSMPVEAR